MDATATSTARRLRPRVIAGLTVVAVLVVAWVTLGGSGGTYTLQAHFSNAGGLVDGGLVEVAGRNVGSISGIGLTPDGEANITLSIDDPSLTPLHLGTRADIRAVGQGTITNNYVLLYPGANTRPTIPSGSVLPLTQTTGIVPIDALLDSFGPAQRRNFDALIADSAQVYAGSGSRSFNRMLDELNPALAQLDGFSGELALDRPALKELVQTAATASSAVAARSSELTAAVSHMAQGLDAVADQRASLNDALKRLPTFIDQTRTTLVRTRAAVDAADPALRDTPPAARALTTFLGATDATLPSASAAIGRLNAQLPSLDRGLNDAVTLKRPAVTALKTIGPAFKSLIPILEGFRYYGTDFVLGFLGGVLALTTGEYDTSGHYVKVNFVESLQTLLAGPTASLLSARPLIPGILGVRTGLLRRCPGGSEPPAPDGSSPWLVGSQYCTPSQDVPLSVDQP
jgi:phospholipid/cholesterol/gamma-HCH transport system substrate-binding protein